MKYLSFIDRIVFSLAAAVAVSAPAAAQTFITADRTIAGGNPLSGDVNGFLVIGADAADVAFPNVLADITGGTIADYVAATSQSIVNISGGLIGKLPEGGTSFTALAIRNGSTINLTGGTINSFVAIGPLFGDDGTINTFNMSGGTVANIYNNGGGIVNMTGGSIVSNDGFSQGSLGNYGNGIVNVTGGTMDIVGNFGFGGGGTINFGGTAITNSLRVFDGVGNVTGGTIGAGVTVRNMGVVNFAGSGLNVTSSGAHGFFDEDYFQNFIIADYSITGTLASGTALNTTVSAGVDFSNDGSTATFNAAALAPDLFVTTDQSVNTIHNYVYVGIDETFSNPADPTVTLADGFDTVELITQSASVTTMTGGVVRDLAFVTENSQFNVTGGEITGGAVAVDDAAILVSGGTLGFLSGGSNAKLTVSGGNIGSYSLYDNTTLTFQGSGLSATGTTGHLWDGFTNYIAAGNFAVTGTLADGTALDQTIRAGGASGTGSQQTLVAPQAAPNLYLTENTTTGALYNQVTVGRSADGTVNTSPTVTVGAGSDLGTVFVNNQATLDVEGGVIRGRVIAGRDTNVNISGGTLKSVYQSGTGTGKIMVSGGSTEYIAPRNLFVMTGGDLATLDTYSGARVRIEGGNITTMLLFGATTGVTDVVISGGSVGTINFQTTGNLVNILGGSVGEVWGGGGGAVNIFGGTIGANTLLNFRTTFTQFNIYGTNLLLSDATLGNYIDNFGTTVNGVWWNLSGTLQSGSELSTRYFERNGSLNGPSNLALTATVPEPGSFTLLALVGLPLAGVIIRGRRSA